jgi:hypothetical protein
MEQKPQFEVCEKCGKKLIERLPNGLWHFLFGKPKEGETSAPVEMMIQGNLKIKCLRRSCGHWNVLNYFPNVLQSEESEKPGCAKTD